MRHASSEMSRINWNRNKIKSDKGKDRKRIVAVVLPCKLVCNIYLPLEIQHLPLYAFLKKKITSLCDLRSPS